MVETHAPRTTSRLATIPQREYLLRLRLARLFAAGTNDWPGWRSVRRLALSRLLCAPGLKMGSHVRLDRSHPELGGRLVLGADVDIGPRVILDTSGGLVIEDEATLSLDAMVLTHDHIIRDGTRHWRSQGKLARPVTIKSEAWVGARAVVIGRTEVVGRGAVVGAGSLVTRPVAELAVVVGVPAKVVHFRQTS